mmetsp:Transcript_27502/g.31803  ORF Transcript_27502/g.31803 Transcript_27502/m.31803 type:complete len:92 (-) Transcript_27502:243-518(-)
MMKMTKKWSVLRNGRPFAPTSKICQSKSSNNNASSSSSPPSDSKILISNINRKAKLVENDDLEFLDAILCVIEVSLKAFRPTFRLLIHKKS